MDTKYKMESTERKAPDISVMVHTEATTQIDVTRGDGWDGASLGIKGFAYPSITIFLSTEKLAELRDAIVAYLDETA